MNFDATELRKIRGAKTQEIEHRLGYKSFDEVIHRDDLILDVRCRLSRAGAPPVRRA